MSSRLPAVCFPQLHRPIQDVNFEQPLGARFGSTYTNAGTKSPCTLSNGQFQSLKPANWRHFYDTTSTKEQSSARDFDNSSLVVPSLLSAATAGSLFSTKLLLCPFSLFPWKFFCMRQDRSISLFQRDRSPIAWATPQLVSCCPEGALACT